MEAFNTGVSELQRRLNRTNYLVTSNLRFFHLMEPSWYFADQIFRFTLYLLII